MGQTIQVQAELRPVGWVTERINPWQTGKKSSSQKREAPC